MTLDGAALCSATQPCPTLWDLMDYRLPGSSVHGVFRREYWSGWPVPLLGDLPDSQLNLLLLRLLHLPLSHHMLTYKIEFKYLSLVP